MHTSYVTAVLIPVVLCVLDDSSHLSQYLHEEELQVETLNFWFKVIYDW